MARSTVAPYTKAESINELYEIQDFVARGGFSEVCKAVHLKTGGIRAVKIMEKEILTGKRAVMVARETEILRRCRHPNILTLFEVVETKMQMCLVMEFISGGDLYDYIVKRKTLTEGEAAKITKCILQAVEYLHGASPPVVHRDIKPENVLIEDVETEKVKLSDFGLSKILVDTKSVECTPGGTSFYLPPEIIDGIKKHGANPRPTNINDMKSLDLWSTGIVLYILLCGSPPFRGTIQGHAERQKLLDQINRGVSFPPQKWSGISDLAKDLVLGLLQIDPTKRLTVRQALTHKWIIHQNPLPAQLQTPSILANEYKNKQEFNNEVEGACKGMQKEVIKGVDDHPAAQSPPKQVVLGAIGGADLLNKRSQKTKT